MYASCSSTKNTKNEFEGTISSPNYPSKYRNSKRCTWKLTGPAGEKLKLDSFTYDIEKEDACKYDSLRIYDGKISQYWLEPFYQENKLLYIAIFKNKTGYKNIFISIRKIETDVIAIYVKNIDKLV